MEKPDNRIDLQFLRETVRQFKKDNRLSDAELGRILDPEIRSATGQSLKGKAFWEEGRDLTLKEVMAIAERMEISFFELLRPISYSGHQGEKSTQVVQNGAGCTVQVGTANSDAEREDYEEFLEFQKWKELKNSARKAG